VSGLVGESEGFGLESWGAGILEFLLELILEFLFELPFLLLA
jgi:hypothetical protein